MWTFVVFNVHMYQDNSNVTQGFSIESVDNEAGYFLTCVTVSNLQPDVASGEFFTIQLVMRIRELSTFTLILRSLSLT